MSNFKVGQKVVFIGGSDLNKIGIYPAVNEIVKIASICNVHSDSYDIEGYLYNKLGFLQSFHSDHLRPLDHQFAEDVIAMITEQVKEEELVIK